jgi:hypothetical protein
MKRTLLLMILLLAAASASAQQYKWIDKNGRVQYGDSPPAGANATPLRPPSGTHSQPAATQDDAKGAARKGPLTPAEQEAEFRKRQEEAGKANEKQAQAAQQAETKRQNCARAQSSLRTLESGQRISGTDAKGERYYFDEAQIAQETAKARQSVQQWCN